MVTRKIIKDLNSYLTDGGHYATPIDAGDMEEINRTVNDLWRDKVENGLAVDFQRILTNHVIIEQKKSGFDIQDDESQGATIWKSFVTLSDKNEKMDVVINFIVNHDNAFIYLGASHSNLDKYSGISKPLRQLFKKLKSNEKVGNFSQTKFYSLD